MTTSPAAPSADMIADAIIDLFSSRDDLDILELADDAAAALPLLAADLRLALDLCPIHHCDLEICADDEIADCAHFYDASNPFAN